MKILLFNILIIFFISCNQGNKKRDNQIERFEQSIGVKELSYINEIIDDFDANLTNNYPDHKFKFKAYLTEISELKKIQYFKIDSTKLKKYSESKLFKKYDTIYPDTVWFNGQSFNIKFPNNEFIEEIIPIKVENTVLNVDSIINSLKLKPKLILIQQSDFIISLSSIKESDSLITNYIETKEILGDLPPLILVNSLLHYLSENNEYFAKRIFVLDMLDNIIHNS